MDLFILKVANQLVRKMINHSEVEIINREAKDNGFR